MVGVQYFMCEIIFICSFLLTRKASVSLVQVRDFSHDWRCAVGKNIILHQCCLALQGEGMFEGCLLWGGIIGGKVYPIVAYDMYGICCRLFLRFACVLGVEAGCGLGLSAGWCACFRNFSIKPAGSSIRHHL